MHTCSVCTATYEIDDMRRELYKKFDAPPQPLCFDCNQKWRLSFRNERSLYQRTCDATGKNIIALYRPESPLTIYSPEHWYSDNWDPHQYGAEYNFNEPFFTQFRRVQQKMPRLALLNMKGENSDYCNSSVGNKNCYLVFGGDFNEDCIYGTLCMHNKYVIDCDFSDRNERCYELKDSEGCYGCRFVYDSKNCRDSAFLSNCIGCTECILCTNLVQKSYCINNKQYSKEEYFKKKAALDFGSHKQQEMLKKMLIEMRKTSIVKSMNMINTENCSGDYTKNSKNCHNVFDCISGEDVIDTIMSSAMKDGFNCSFVGHKSESCYNTISSLGAYNAHYCYFIIESSDIRYSWCCLSSQNLFGCIGLRNKSYCILNKQYSKEEYEELVPRIIKHMKSTGEWGQFFPKHFADFCYNETCVFDYYPLTKEQALKEGFMWYDKTEKQEEKEISNVPDHIKDVTDQITKGAICCNECGKHYRVTPQELAFYKDFIAPIPQTCSECRHRFRMDLRNPKKLWNRECTRCHRSVKSTYDPKRSEKIHCNECYSAEVF